MKILKLFLLLTFGFFLSRCGTVDSSINGRPPSVLEGAKILDTSEVKFFEFAKMNGEDPATALQLTKEWVKTQSNVAEAESIDDFNLRIKLKSGLSVNFALMPINKDGFCSFRGGGHETSGLGTSSDILTKPINNKKVLIYAAAFDDFYKTGEMEKLLSIFNKSKIKFDVKLLKNLECSPDIISTFGDYGLVIMDTHGQPDGFLTGSKINFDTIPTEEIEVQSKIQNSFPSSDIYNKILSGELYLGISVYRDFSNPSWKRTVNRTGIYQIWASAKHISGLTDMPNTVILANCCFSGYGNTPPKAYFPTPIRQAFIGKKLISYYGYTYNDNFSREVSDLFAKEMEITLVQALVIDLDSTKIANLDENNNEYYDKYYTPSRPIHGELYLRHFNSDDYIFNECADVFTDNRDGIIYKSVCMGKQIWMAENLRYNAPGSVFYDDLPANGTIYGKLYDWSTAMNGSASSTANPSGVQGICPKGWHIPSPAEWDYLKIVVAKNNIGDLKDKNLWNTPNLGATDLYGFSARGGGWYYQDIFQQLNKFGSYITSEQLPSGGSNEYQFKYWTTTLDKVASGGSKKISCRCVKD